MNVTSYNFFSSFILVLMIIMYGEENMTIWVVEILPADAFKIKSIKLIPCDEACCFVFLLEGMLWWFLTCLTYSPAKNTASHEYRSGELNIYYSELLCKFIMLSVDKDLVKAHHQHTGNRSTHCNLLNWYKCCSHISTLTKWLSGHLQTLE